MENQLKPTKLAGHNTTARYEGVSFLFYQQTKRK